jgi:hypothetical protein
MLNYWSFKPCIFVSSIPQPVEKEWLRHSAMQDESWKKPNLLPKDYILIIVKLFSTLKQNGILMVKY